MDPTGFELTDDAEIILPIDEDGEAVVVLSRRDAFNLLIEQHHDRLARLAYLMCRNTQEAEDAVAEAYAQVWPKVRRGNVENIPAALRTAVIRCVYGGHRQRAKEQREAERRKVDWRDGIAFETATDNAEVVKAALLTLSLEHRAVVVLRFFDDMTEEDTAKTLGLKVGTVKSRSSRALRQLRAQLGPTFDSSYDVPLAQPAPEMGVS